MAESERRRDGDTTALHSQVLGPTDFAEPDEPPDPAAECIAGLERLRREWRPSTEVLSPVEVPQAAPSGWEEEFVGKHLGRFRLDRPIGGGGFGIVFLAVDEELGRKVALKVLRQDFARDPQQRERFLRESRAAGRVHHPNLVDVLHAGQEDEICYHVQPYVDGGNLAQWMSQHRPVPTRLAAEIVAQLADGLDAMHRRGVLHRDIKPSNVLLRLGPTAACVAPDGVRFTPMLTDFGLAKLLDDESDGTRTGVLLGTPRYMAPEQALGQADRTGTGTDIHALGLLLYELLTQRGPYGEEVGYGNLLRIVNDSPVPPRRHRPDCPRDLEAICLRCLEKEPKERYASAWDLAADLRRFLANQPTLARPLSAARQLGRAVRRRPLLSASIGLALVALVILFVGTLWSNARFATLVESIEDERNAARASEALATEQSDLAKSLLYSGDLYFAYKSWQNLDRRTALEHLERHLGTPGEEDRRCFAWHYLWRQLHPEGTVLQGHDGPVYRVVWSPDGQHLVSGGRDGRIHVWSAPSRERVATLTHHENEVNEIVFAPRGGWFVTGSDDTTLRVWKSLDDPEPEVWREHESFVYGLAISPDERLIVSGDQAGLVLFWDAETGRVLGRRQLEDSTGNIKFWPDGKRLVVALASGKVEVWDLLRIDDQAGGRSSRVEVEVVAELDGSFRNGGLAVSPNGEWLAVGAHSNLRLWHRDQLGVEDDKATYDLAPHRDRLMRIAIAPGGNLLATAASDGTVCVWETRWEPSLGLRTTDRAPIPVCWRTHDSRVWHAEFSPDGRFLATSCESGKIYLWPIGPRHRPMRLIEGSARLGPTGMAVHPTLPRIALAAALTGSIEELDLRGEPHYREIARVPVGIATCISYDPTGRFVCCARWDGRDGTTVHLLEVESGRQVWQTEVPDLQTAQPLRFSPDGAVVAVSGRDNVVAILDTATGGLRLRLPPLKGERPRPTVLFGAEGYDLWTHDEVELSRWHLTEDRSAILSAEAMKPGIRFGRLHPLAGDPNHFLVACLDRTIRALDSRSGETKWTLAGYDGLQLELASTKDGKLLASGSPTVGRLSFADLRTRQQCFAIDLSPAGPIAGVAFLAEERGLVVMHDVDEYAQLWLLTPEAPQEQSIMGR